MWRRPGPPALYLSAHALLALLAEIKHIFVVQQFFCRVVNIAVSALLDPISTSSAYSDQDGLEVDAALERVETATNADPRQATAAVVGGSAGGEDPNHGEQSRPRFSPN